MLAVQHAHGGQRHGERLACLTDIDAVRLVIADHRVGALKLAGDLVIESLGSFLHRARSCVLAMLGEVSDHGCVAGQQQNVALRQRLFESAELHMDV